MNIQDENSVDYLVYSNAKEGISSGNIRSRGGVCASIAYGLKGVEVISSMYAHCHAFIEREKARVYYVLTSLRKFRPSVYDKETKTRAESFYRDILELSLFKPIKEEVVIIPGIPGSYENSFNISSKDVLEDWLLIKVTDLNRHLVLSFLVLTRHPYEQNPSCAHAVSKGNTKYGSTYLSLFGAWYEFTHLRRIPFDIVFTMGNTMGYDGTNIELMFGPPGHSAFDGISLTHVPIPKSDMVGKWGYSQQVFNFYTSVSKLSTIVTSFKVGKPIEKKRIDLGYFNNPSLYYPLQGKDQSGEDKGAKPKNPSLVLGTPNEAAVLLPKIYEELYKDA